jgi:hypothetical protein
MKWTLLASTQKVRFLVDGLEPFKPNWFAVSAAGEGAKPIRPSGAHRHSGCRSRNSPTRFLAGLLYCE